MGSSTYGQGSRGWPNYHSYVHPRIVTRSRGEIPGCKPAGPDDHMARDNRGRPWVEVAKEWQEAQEFQAPPKRKRK